MNKLLKLSRILAGRQDIILAVVLIMAVFMIILPLPTMLIDVLIALNLCVSLLLMMIAVYVKEPLEFSSFPSVLLITTLYRLSLSISTTRLILLQHDAGEIVYTFGNFVVGGNLGVGLIIFSIITIVQFIVITKGSERVAEVGARFSLDGMPGKQMSIDGDMRAGTIDANEARRLRSIVQKESQLYGAMDGAMKFVKGDAIASMIIVLVNIIGGGAIGMFAYSMSASEALNTYAILSIGDGLISQIPALLISITAGIIVTRVPGQESKNLATEMVGQMTVQPRPLYLASGMLLLFAFLPGFPMLVFMTLSAVLGGGAWYLTRKSMGKGTTGGKHYTSTNGICSQDHEIKPGSVPLILNINKALNSDDLELAIQTLKWSTFEDLGIVIPDIVINRSETNNTLLYLYQEMIATLPLELNDVLFTNETAALSELNDVREFSLFGGNTYWLCNSEHMSQELIDSGLKGDDAIIWFVNTLIRKHAKEFIGVQETKVLMDSMEHDYSELVKEVQRLLPLGKIADILQRLVEEGISIRDLRNIFETLIIWSVKEKDPIVLVEYVRSALRRHLIRRFQDDKGILNVWAIGNSIEESIRESIRQTSAGTYSALEPEQIEKIIMHIKYAIDDRHDVILITAVDVRRYLCKICESHFSRLSVISYQEIGDQVPVNILGNIEIIGGH